MSFIYVRGRGKGNFNTPGNDTTDVSSYPESQMRILNKIFFFSLSLYFLLAAFVHPVADDFTNAVAVLQKGFWQAQVDVYTNWFGRYFSTFLMFLNPTITMNLFLYRIYCLFSFCFLGFGIYFFIACLFAGLKKYEKVTLALGFFSVFVSRMPSVVEGFFWLPGHSNYTLGLPLFLIAGGLILRQLGLQVMEPENPSKPKTWTLLLVTVLTLLSFLICGINEMIMLLWCGFLFSLLVWHFNKSKSLHKELLFLMIFSALCGLFVILSPGNQIRGAHFENNFNLFTATYKSLGFGFWYFFRFFGLASVVLLFLAGQWVVHNKERINPAIASKEFRNWLWWGLFVVLVLAIFPAFFGMDSRPPRRALNMICFFHNIFVGLMVLSLVLDPHSWLHQRVLINLKKFSSFWTDSKIIAVLLMALFVIGNHRRAIVDLTLHAQEYDQVMDDRYQLARQSQGQDLVFTPLKHRPITLCFDDIEANPEDWKNTSFAALFGLKSVRTSAP